MRLVDVDSEIFCGFEFERNCNLCMCRVDICNDVLITMSVKVGTTDKMLLALCFRVIIKSPQQCGVLHHSFTTHSQGMYILSRGSYENVWCWSAPEHHVAVLGALNN